MKGEDNAVFEGDSSLERVTYGGENGLVLATRPTSGEETNHESEAPSEPAKGSKEIDMSSIDPFSRALVTVRSTSYNFLVDHKTATKYTVLFALNGALLAYLIGAIMFYVDYDECDVDWCSGVGLLIILYVIVYGCLFYFLVLKRFCGEPFFKHVFQPMQSFFGRLWKFWYCRLVLYLIPVVGLVAYLVIDTEDNRDRLWSFLGVVVFMLFGFIFSKYPGHINWRPVFWGLALQFIFGLITIRWSTGRSILMCVGNKVATFLSYTNNGTTFVYGHLITDTSQGTVFAFATLPVIFFFSFFVNILSYYGALQWFIMKIAWGIQSVMGTTVCESVNAAASIFLGMTESPLLFRNYVKDLTKSELHAIMCEGWATIAGTVMAAYISFGVSPAHLIGSSVMSAPAALCYSKLFYPETEESKNRIDNIVLVKESANNVLDAACKGAMAALDLVAGITANIIAFLGFVAFLDGVINWLGVLVGAEELTFQYLLSKIFIPVSFLMGVDSESLEDVAILVGTKTVVNEFKAYEIMGEMIKEGKLSARTQAIATYALCGFSNFSSIGILIGGLSGLAPSQRSNMTEVALRGFIAANIVCFLTACIAGTLISDDFVVDA